jgi:hypothetical protein
MVRGLALTAVVVVAWMAGPGGDVAAAAARTSAQAHAVRAAPGTSGPAGDLLFWLHGGTRDHAAMASGGIYPLNVFIRGLDSALWYDGESGGPSGWSGWQWLGGNLLSSPAAVSWGPGRLDVFAIGVDRAMWHIAWTGSGWSSWQSLGGGFLSGPAASSWTANVLDVEAVGLDRAMWHSRWDGSHWSAWEWLGGGFTSDPAAVAPPFAFDRIDLYARGLDGQMYVNVENGSPVAFWTGWQALGGGFNSGPAVTWTSQQRLIYALGLDSRLYCNDGAGWILEPSAPARLPPAVPATDGDNVAMASVANDSSVQVNILMRVVGPVDC